MHLRLSHIFREHRADFLGCFVFSHAASSTATTGKASSIMAARIVIAVKVAVPRPLELEDAAATALPTLRSLLTIFIEATVATVVAVNKSSSPAFHRI
jgi:hypothetical protein